MKHIKLYDSQSAAAGEKVDIPAIVGISGISKILYIDKTGKITGTTVSGADENNQVALQTDDDFISIIPIATVKYQHYSDTEHYYDTLEDAGYGVYEKDGKYYFAEDEESTPYDTEKEAKAAFVQSITKYVGHGANYDTEEEAKQSYTDAGEDAPDTISIRYDDGASDYQLSLADALLVCATHENAVGPEYPGYYSEESGQSYYGSEEEAKQSYTDAGEVAPDPISPMYAGMQNEEGNNVYYSTLKEAIESYMPESIDVNEDGSYTGYNDNTYSTEELAKKSYVYCIVVI